MIERKISIKGETEQLVKKMMGTERLLIICPLYVYPNLHQIRSSDTHNSFSIDTQTLFEILKIPQEKLKEVYEFNEKVGLFIGSFAKNGKQNLANLLKKPLEFFPQIDSKPILKIASRQIFEPQEDKNKNIL
jgi:hypothetical protein